MAYQEVTKQQVAAAYRSEIDFSDILSNYPEGELEQDQAEQLSQEITQKIHDEACKVIDPIKQYPPILFVY